MRLKNDAQEFIDTIDLLIDGGIVTNLPLRKQKMIPKFVYHFTDMGNAKSILETGQIFSRKKAFEKGLMSVDNASHDVISYTNDKWKNYARFYFRPKTPTQFRNEGIQSKQSFNELNAHCPVPIFFLFDSKAMLIRADSFFSYGSLAVDNAAYNQAKDFKKMPFQYVYHEGSYDTTLQWFIKNNRHAELIIPEECSLENLKAILCRSTAEKETFLNQLSPATRLKYQDIIHVDSRNDFFNGERTFVEKANLTKEEIVFTINKGFHSSVFNVILKTLEHSTNIVYTWGEDKLELNQSLAFNLLNLKDPTSYEVKLYLDEHLAFHGSFKNENLLPF